MNVTTRVRRTTTASTLAVAALAIAACTTDESIPEAPPSNGEGSIELSATPDPVMLNDSGTTEYTADGRLVEIEPPSTVGKALAYVIFAVIVAVIIVAIMWIAKDFIFHSTGFNLFGAAGK